jgi:predicted nucleic acid-binding protein
VPYLLDTNAVSDIVALNPRFMARLSATSPIERVFVTTTVEGEVL